MSPQVNILPSGARQQENAQQQQQSQNQIDQRINELSSAVEELWRQVSTMKREMQQQAHQQQSMVFQNESGSIQIQSNVDNPDRNPESLNTFDCSNKSICKTANTKTSSSGEESKVTRQHCRSLYCKVCQRITPDKVPRTTKVDTFVSNSKDFVVTSNVKKSHFPGIDQRSSGWIESSKVTSITGTNKLAYVVGPGEELQSQVLELTYPEYEVFDSYSKVKVDNRAIKLLEKEVIECNREEIFASSSGNNSRSRNSALMSLDTNFMQTMKANQSQLDSKKYQAYTNSESSDSDYEDVIPNCRATLRRGLVDTNKPVEELESKTIECHPKEIFTSDSECYEEISIDAGGSTHQEGNSISNVNSIDQAKKINESDDEAMVEVHRCKREIDQIITEMREKVIGKTTLESEKIKSEYIRAVITKIEKLDKWSDVIVTKYLDYLAIFIRDKRPSEEFIEEYFKKMYANIPTYLRKKVDQKAMFVYETAMKILCGEEERQLKKESDTYKIYRSSFVENKGHKSIKQIMITQQELMRVRIAIESATFICWPSIYLSENSTEDANQISGNASSKDVQISFKQKTTTQDIRDDLRDNSALANQTSSLNKRRQTKNAIQMRKIRLQAEIQEMDLLLEEEYADV